ncbi:hypothetical protein [Pararhodobacter sp.]|uniref:hypothetical protein n=1 Tax=Pararhodobacter sp. TaxID=2127056 RepID=UPI002FDCB224
MRPVKSLALALMLAMAPMAAGAQSLIASYAAFIGEDDLFNSSGTRLGEFWQILRQDRANYHRFGLRQRGDQGDPFFADANNRATLEQLLRNSDTHPSTRRLIISGNVPVYVEIFGYGNRMTAVRVQVPG